jgi:REP element-mobilizing transposase RayT
VKILLTEIASQTDNQILTVEIMSDHVHLFVSAPPRYSPTGIVLLSKGILSKRLMPVSAILRHYDWGEKAPFEPKVPLATRLDIPRVPQSLYAHIPNH